MKLHSTFWPMVCNLILLISLMDSHYIEFGFHWLLSLSIGIQFHYWVKQCCHIMVIWKVFIECARWCMCLMKSISYINCHSHSFYIVLAWVECKFKVRRHENQVERTYTRVGYTRIYCEINFHFCNLFSPNCYACYIQQYIINTCTNVSMFHTSSL